MSCRPFLLFGSIKCGSGFVIAVVCLSGADICGENGEYHSFVYDDPIFRHPVDFRIKGQYRRDYPGGGADEVHRYGYRELT